MPDPSIVQQFELEQASDYLAYSMGALYLFECLITFSQEVEVIWMRQWSFMTWIYAFTRYSSFLLFIFDLAPDYSFMVTQYLIDAMYLIQLLCFACFSALRVYALLDGKKLIAGIVFLLNLVPVATNLYDYVVGTFDTELWAVIEQESPSLSFRCVVVILPIWWFSDALRLTLLTNIAVIIGDVLVLLVTWFKTFQLSHRTRRLGIQAPLATLLFCNGMIYFVILLIINILWVIEAKNSTLYTLDLPNQLLGTITPIIICRFILDLRQFKPSCSSWASGSQSASIRFAGNAGGSLRFGPDEDEEGEESVGEYLSQDESFVFHIVDEDKDGGIYNGDRTTG